MVDLNVEVSLVYYRGFYEKGLPSVHLFQLFRRPAVFFFNFLRGVEKMYHDF